MGGLLLAALLAVALVAVTVRERRTSPRERLLERDVLRLQTELANAHDKLLHAVEKPWTLAPADVAEPLDADDDDEPDRFLTESELSDDLLLVPETVEVSAW